MAQESEEFRTLLRTGLQRLEEPLIAVLRQLLVYKYPPEIVAISFEVFSDSWSQGFPARAFFLDETNSEFFVYVNGDAKYPSPVDPELLDVPFVITPEDEDRIIECNPDLDTYSVGAEEFISWFIDCWNKAGGASFQLHASIAEHDSGRQFNLVSGKWLSP
jgi:hypothetical protein